jgi:hypothetical protein
VSRLEEEQRELRLRRDRLLKELGDICDDTGDSSSVSIKASCDSVNLRQEIQTLSESLQSASKVREELRAHLTEERKRMFERAENEGITLPEIKHDSSVKLREFKQSLRVVEEEWPRLQREAEEQRQKLHCECQELCNLLRETYCPPIMTPASKQLSSLKSLLESLGGKVERRRRELEECRDTFKDLNMADSLVIDMADLSVFNVTKWQQMRQQAVKDHRDKIVAVYRESVGVLTDLLEALNDTVPARLLADVGSNMDTIDTQVLMGHLRELRQLTEETRPRAERARLLTKLFKERKALIVQMQVFEKTASDPARLFAPSFRLVQEERFRKSAVPNLRRLEQRLLHELDKFEQDAANGQNGWVYEVPVEGGAGRAPLRAVLETEMAERFVNEAVFGFHPDGAKSEGPPAPKRQRENSINSASSSSSGSSKV